MTSETERAQGEWAARLGETVEKVVSFASPPTTGGDDRYTPFKSLGECETAAIKAVRLLEEAEDIHSNCKECEGEGVPESCGECFPYFDAARVQRRLVMQSLAALATAQAAEGELDSYEKFDGVGPHAETIETRARIGERYLEAYESALTDPRLAGYMPADCPSELLIDLLNGTWLAQPTTDPVSREAAASALDLARPIVEADLHAAIEQCDADWEGMSRTALDAIDAALRALPAAQAGRVGEDLGARLTDAYAALRSIAEGNLGDLPWQASYDTIRQVARNALPNDNAALSPPSTDGEEGT